ncbi:MAG: S-layer homology domain-containing protein [Clostridia bacterium]|nr:S-layer homology domain-containing protein [Clostridia bacterium]
MRKILTAACMVFAITAATAFAEDFNITVSYNSSQKFVNIIGNISEKENLLAVLAITPEGTDISESEENIIVDACYTDKDGKINITEYIPQDFPGGKYVVCVTSENGELSDYFMNVNYSSVSDLLPELNGTKSQDELIKVINNNKAALAIDDKTYEPYKTKITEMLYRSKSDSAFKDARDFIYRYNNAAAAVHIKNGGSIAEILKKYASELNINYNDYETLTDGQKQLFDQYVVSDSYDDLNTEFKNARALSMIKCAKNKKELKDNFTANESVINPDLSYYSKLKLGDKAFEELYAKKDSINSISELKDAFLNITKALYNAENREEQSGGGGGSSGGSPGSGGRAPAAGMQNKNENNKTDTVFYDIENHWAKEYILDMYDKGVINGYTDKTFRPEKLVTRAEFAKMTVEAFGLSGNAELTFKDVSKTDWYYNAVSTACGCGLINGVSKEAFCPNEYITRQDAAVILNRVIEKNIQPDSGNLNFADYDEISDYARDAVMKLTASGIISGMDGSFKPKDGTTRGQAAVLLSKASELNFRKGADD